jgi:hypothetical protein
VSSGHPKSPVRGICTSGNSYVSAPSAIRTANEKAIALRGVAKVKDFLARISRAIIHRLTRFDLPSATIFAPRRRGCVQ